MAAQTGTGAATPGAHRPVCVSMQVWACPCAPSAGQAGPDCLVCSLPLLCPRLSALLQVWCPGHVQRPAKALVGWASLQLQPHDLAWHAAVWASRLWAKPLLVRVAERKCLRVGGLVWPARVSSATSQRHCFYPRNVCHSTALLEAELPLGGLPWKHCSSESVAPLSARPDRSQRVALAMAVVSGPWSAISSQRMSQSMAFDAA